MQTKAIEHNTTLNDLANHLGLHKATVSRILNGKTEGYSEETRRRVVQAALELNYRPHPMAKALATGATQTVGVWGYTPIGYSPYLGMVHYLLQRQAGRRGYHLISSWIDHEDPERSERGIPDLAVDGILAVDVLPWVRKTLQDRHSRPIVSLGEWSDADHDLVGVDIYEGARLAVQHLVELGCQRVAFAHAIKRGARPLAYRNTVEAAGLQPEYLEAIDGTSEAGYAAVIKSVTRDNHPDGIFCFNDEVAAGVHRALLEIGLRVPQDVQIVGFDGLASSEFNCHPLTTVELPIVEMCETAWDLLDKRMADRQMPTRQIRLVPRLHRRGTTRS